MDFLEVIGLLALGAVFFMLIGAYVRDFLEMERLDFRASLEDLVDSIESPHMRRPLRTGDEYFESMFFDHDIPLECRWSLPEGWRIRLDLCDGSSCHLSEGDSLGIYEDSLVIYNEGRGERHYRYVDWSHIASICVSSPEVDEPEVPEAPTECGVEFPSSRSIPENGNEPMSEKKFVVADPSAKFVSPEGPVSPIAEPMSEEKLAKIKGAGWKVGDAEEFLDDIEDESVLSEARPHGDETLRHQIYRDMSEAPTKPVIPEYEPSGFIDKLDGQWVVDTFHLWRFLFGYTPVLTLHAFELDPGPRLKSDVKSFSEVEEFEEWMKDRKFALDVSSEDKVADGRTNRQRMHDMYATYSCDWGREKALERRAVFDRVVAQVPRSKVEGSTTSDLPEIEAKPVIDAWQLWRFLFNDAQSLSVGELEIGGRQAFTDWLESGPSEYIVNLGRVEEMMKEMLEVKEYFVLIHGEKVAEMRKDLYLRVLYGASEYLFDEASTSDLPEIEAKTCEASTECGLRQEVCRECIDRVSKEIYGGAFSWGGVDDAHWSDGMVNCPGDHSIEEDGEGGGLFPTSEVPAHCPHAEKHVRTECGPHPKSPAILWHEQRHREENP